MRFAISSRGNRLRMTPAPVLLLAALLTGCSDLPPAGEMFDLSAAGEGTGAQFVGLVKAVKVVATYRATERQRREATARAQKVQAQQQARIDARARQASKSYAARAKSKTDTARKYAAEAARMEAKAKSLAAAKEAEASAARSRAAAARKKADDAARAAKEAEQSVARAAEKTRKAEAKKAPSILAIPVTPAAGKSEANQGKNYLLFDTETREVVENKVYVIEKAPKDVLAKFDTYTAQVVGAGG